MLDNKTRFRSWIIGAGVGVMIALLLAPASRWLVRAQLALALPTHDPIAPQLRILGVEMPPAEANRVDRVLADVAPHYPNDYQIQLADALTRRPQDGRFNSDVKVERLRALTGRFPNNASLYANILRFTTAGSFAPQRDEEGLFTENPTPSKSAKSKQVTPEELAAFDRDAANGERLDPENAYFPFMRSIGLFAAHQDTEALAAIQRASTKPVWNEYYNDELHGEWKLQTEAFGTQSGLTHIATAAAILLPQYSRLRTAGRVAVALAILEEQSGHFEEGCSIRRAVAKCGSLIRVQGTWAISNLVGIALTNLSMERPGGAPILKQKSSTQQEADAANLWAEQLLHDYTTYLRRIGYSNDIGWITHEVEAGRISRDIIRHGINSGPFGASTARLVDWWRVGTGILCGALWMAALAVLGTCLARLSHFQAGKALPNYVGVGIWAGLLPGTLATCAYLSSGTQSLSFLVGAVVMSLLPLLVSTSRGGYRLRRLGVLVVTAVCMFAVCYSASVQMRGLEPLVRVLWNLTNTQTSQYILAVNNALFCLFTFSVPVGTVLVISAVSRYYRVPVSVGLVRGLRGIALPIACGLFLIYGGITLTTLRLEASYQTAIDRTVASEGSYLAELQGKKWPDAP